MAEPTGIATLARKYPERAYDVGIAEQHAATSAAGLAMGGLHPVVAIYATFLNRAFDQVLLDVAMHRLPVTFVLDRAGITGPDGPSHYGIWDMSVFGVVPGLRIAAPRDAATLREALREAVAVDDGPTIVRFPTGSVPADLPAIRRESAPVDVLAESARTDVLLVAVGAFGHLGVEVAARLGEHGYGVTVVDPRWVRPVPVELVGLAAGHRLVVTVEDGVRTGGVGDAVAKALRDAGRTGAVARHRRAGRLAPARQPRRDPLRPRPHRPGRRPRRDRLDLAAGRAGGDARRGRPGVRTPQLTVPPRRSWTCCLPKRAIR